MKNRHKHRKHRPVYNISNQSKFYSSADQQLRNNHQNIIYIPSTHHCREKTGESSNEKLPPPSLPVSKPIPYPYQLAEISNSNPSYLRQYQISSTSQTSNSPFFDRTHFHHHNNKNNKRNPVMLPTPVSSHIEGRPKCSSSSSSKNEDESKNSFMIPRNLHHHHVHHHHRIYDEETFLERYPDVIAPPEHYQNLNPHSFYTESDDNSRCCCAGFFNLFCKMCCCCFFCNFCEQEDESEEPLLSYSYITDPTTLGQMYSVELTEKSSKETTASYDSENLSQSFRVYPIKIDLTPKIPTESSIENQPFREQNVTEKILNHEIYEIRQLDEIESCLTQVSLPIQIIRKPEINVSGFFAVFTERIDIPPDH